MQSKTKSEPLKRKTGLLTMDQRDHLESLNWISEEEEHDGGVNLQEDGDDSDFEFVLRDPDSGKEITADEMFASGRIRPGFPLFGRPLSPTGDASTAAAAAADLEPETRISMQKLLIEERDSHPASTSSSECDELESIPDTAYCPWSPEKQRRSSSAGESRRWRLMDLVEGRSRSDGNKRFVRMPPEEKDKKPTSSASKEGEKKPPKVGKVTELDMVTAHKLYYSKKGGDGMKTGRKSSLPYRPGFIGLFGNAANRTHSPF